MGNKTFLRHAEPVHARDGGDDDRVASLEERARRLVSERVHSLVNARALLEEFVRDGQVGLGAVKVKVRYKELDGVGGEEGGELGVELRREHLRGDQGE